MSFINNIYRQYVDNHTFKLLYCETIQTLVVARFYRQAILLQYSVFDLRHTGRWEDPFDQMTWGWRGMGKHDNTARRYIYTRCQQIKNN